MNRYKKVGEFYTESTENDEKFIKIWENNGFTICRVDDWGNGSEFILMEKED